MMLMSAIMMPSRKRSTTTLLPFTTALFRKKKKVLLLYDSLYFSLHEILSSQLNPISRSREEGKATKRYESACPRTTLLHKVQPYTKCKQSTKCQRYLRTCSKPNWFLLKIFEIYLSFLLLFIFLDLYYFFWWIDEYVRNNNVRDMKSLSMYVSLDVIFEKAKKFNNG
jgi:hypothetical protein